MKEYKILQGKDQWSLEKDVNTAIKEGWQPTGGIFICNHPSYTYYYQAMIREEL